MRVGIYEPCPNQRYDASPLFPTGRRRDRWIWIMMHGACSPHKKTTKIRCWWTKKKICHTMVRTHGTRPWSAPPPSRKEEGPEDAPHRLLALDHALPNRSDPLFMAQSWSSFAISYIQGSHQGTRVLLDKIGYYKWYYGNYHYPCSRTVPGVDTLPLPL